MSNNRNYSLVNCFILMVISFMFVACKTVEKDNKFNTPPETLYKHGLTLFKKQDYAEAAEEFSYIFFQNPSHPLTPQSELMHAYSLYKAREYDTAIDILDLFIKLHPRHKYIEYAFYLKAISDYEQLSTVDLDQSHAQYAKQSIQDVINLFPNTEYANDALTKLSLVNDHLAGHEMLIGLYYLKKQNVIAAIRRFQTVLQEYSTTSHAPEALYRLIIANIMLGLNDEAKKYFAVLKYNYPKNKWTTKSLEAINN